MSGKEKPMQPTHRIGVLTVDGRRKGTIGAAWLQADGSLFIKLDPCNVLRWDDAVTVKLFPIDRKESE